MKSPSLVSACTAPIAAPAVLVGRMIEQGANFRLRNGQGSGMISLPCKDSEVLPASSRKCTFEPVTGSTSVRVGTFPALSWPSLEVSRLGRPDAEQDSQDFDVGYSLSQRRAEAAAALLDGTEVKACGEGDRLEMIRNVKGGDVGGTVQGRHRSWESRCD